MKTMYFAVKGEKFSVTPYTIIKEDRNFVYGIDYKKRNFIQVKATLSYRYFDTELEAWQWLYSEACEEYNTAKWRADTKLETLNKISEELKKHK